MDTKVEVPTGGYNVDTGLIYRELSEGAQALTLVGLIVAVVLYRNFGNYFKEFLQRHLELMEALKQATEANSETMATNAKTMSENAVSLRRLAKTNHEISRKLDISIPGKLEVHQVNLPDATHYADYKIEGKE